MSASFEKLIGLRRINNEIDRFWRRYGCKPGFIANHLLENKSVIDLGHVATDYQLTQRLKSSYELLDELIQNAPARAIDRNTKAILENSAQILGARKPEVEYRAPIISL